MKLRRQTPIYITIISVIGALLLAGPGFCQTTGYGDNDTGYGDENPVEPPQLPEAWFSYTMDSEYAPAEVSFYDESDNLDNVARLYREWDFDDGNDSTYSEPTHIFEEPGTYCVTFTLNWGRDSSSCTTDITIKEQPVAVIGANPRQDRSDMVNGQPGLTVTFTNYSYGDYDNYIWDTGSSVPPTGSSFGLTYVTLGDYTITLTLTDERGNAVSEDSVSVHICLKGTDTFCSYISSLKKCLSLTTPQKKCLSLFILIFFL